MCIKIDWIFFFRNQIIWNHRFQQQAISFRTNRSKFGHKANDINNDPQQIKYTYTHTQPNLIK